jgi:hypothetical protein
MLAGLNSGIKLRNTKALTEGSLDTTFGSASALLPRVPRHLAPYSPTSAVGPISPTLGLPRNAR